MDKRIYFGSGLLALAMSLAACGGGSPVTIKYISPGGPDNCYLAAFSGELVSDPIAGTVFIDQYGRRMNVLWPKGWTARSSGSEVEVLDPRGTVVARTGASFSPDGGINSDGNWEMCGMIMLRPAG